MTVIRKMPSSTWFQDGGLHPSLDDPLASIDEKDAKDRIFYCQKWYDPNSARFEDPPPLPEDVKERKASEIDFCEGCYWTEIEDNRLEPVPGLVAPRKEEDIHNDDDDVVEFQSIVYDKETYVPGDCVYVLPTVYDYVIPAKKPEFKKVVKKDRDPATYTEYYRKTEFSSDYIKGSNEACPPPFRVARIIKISLKMGGNSEDSDEEGRGSRSKRRQQSFYEILLRKFYRPEDTHLEAEETKKFDFNCLFWSDEETSIGVEELQGKCFVRYFDPWTSQAVRDEYFQTAPDRFYFQKSYDSLARRFCAAPMEFLAPKSAIPSCPPDAEEKELMVVVEKLDRGEVEDVRLSAVPPAPEKCRPLRLVA